MNTHDKQIAALIAIGIMPAMAERAVTLAEHYHHKPLTTRQAQRFADVTDADIEQARLWWYYTPNVSNNLRRILDAKQATNA
mgnify:CR=1 FL=1